MRIRVFYLIFREIVLFGVLPIPGVPYESRLSLGHKRSVLQCKTNVKIMGTRGGKILAAAEDLVAEILVALFHWFLALFHRACRAIELPP